jgi:hypothetical protein
VTDTWERVTDDAIVRRTPLSFGRCVIVLEVVIRGRRQLRRQLTVTMAAWRAWTRSARLVGEASPPVKLQPSWLHQVGDRVVSLLMQNGPMRHTEIERAVPGGTKILAYLRQHGRVSRIERGLYQAGDACESAG